MRPLTVPMGVSSMEAISEWVKPPKYASWMTRLCSSGSSSISAWISRAWTDGASR